MIGFLLFLVAAFINTVLWWCIDRVLLANPPLAFKQRITISLETWCACIFVILILLPAFGIKLQ